MHPFSKMSPLFKNVPPLQKWTHFSKLFPFFQKVFPFFRIVPFFSKMFPFFKNGSLFQKVSLFQKCPLLGPVGPYWALMSPKSEFVSKAFQVLSLSASRVPDLKRITRLVTGSPRAGQTRLAAQASQTGYWQTGREADQ